MSYCVKWKLLKFSNKIWIFALKKLLGFPWFLRVASIWISRQSIRVFLAFESSVFKSSSIVWIYALKCFSFFYTSWLLGIWIFAPKKLLGISKLKSLVLKALISSVYLIYTFSNKIFFYVSFFEFSRQKYGMLSLQFEMFDYSPPKFLWNYCLNE